MKIRPNYLRSRHKWYFVMWSRKEHRPPARLHRDHHKLAEQLRRALLVTGHKCQQRYIYGRTWFRCDRCGKRFELLLNARDLPIVATCSTDEPPR